MTRRNAAPGSPPDGHVMTGTTMSQLIEAEARRDEALALIDGALGRSRGPWVHVDTLLDIRSAIAPAQPEAAT